MATNEEFLSTIKGGCIQGWRDHAVLASISGAQAILESNWGKSTLALQANNLFGIKGDYNGASFSIETKEFIDKVFKIVDATFRKYPSWSESITDHSAFFTSTEWRKNNYAAVVGETDYKKAAQALSDAGYATDPDYPAKLIKLIETHDLQQWDVQAPAETPEVVKEEATMALSATNYKQFNGLDIWFGHGNGDPGAQSSGYQEQDMVRRLQTSLKKYADKAGVAIRFYVGNMYADNNVAWSKWRAVIELHLDSAGTAGQGGHVIIQEGIGGLDAIDKNIIEKLKENFGIVNRDGAGYDERTDLANPRRCAAAGINYRLVELFFINDATDRNYFLYNMDEVARDLISAYIGSEVGKTTVAQTPTAPTTASNGFRVKVTTDALNVRYGPGTGYGIASVIRDKGVYTITATSGNWGKLKSGAGWISLSYAERV